MTPPGISLAALARVLRAAADECDLIAREASVSRSDWLSQSESPLGPRRHIEAVRRRLSAGMDGAGKAGRRYLLSPAAIAEELARENVKHVLQPDVTADLAARLRLVGGAL